MKLLSPIVIVAAVACLVALSGCTTLSKLTTPAAQPYVQVAVTVAVAAAVGTDVTKQKAKAAQIKAIAQEILLVDEGASVPLTQLQAAVNAKVASLNLPAGDVLAAQLLTSALAAAVQAEISSVTNGAVSPTTQAAVAAVLNDVIVATAAYGA